MRCFALLLVACAGAGCADYDERRTECAPDLSLVGFPGVVGNTRQFRVSGGEVVELCTRLDTTRNSGDVTLTARLTFSPFPLSLHGLDGQVLAEGAGRIEFRMPSGDVLHAILAFTVPETIATTTANLALDFNEAL